MWYVVVVVVVVFLGNYVFIVVGVRKCVKWHLLSLFLQSENATWATLSRDQCLKYGGALVGDACGFVPDITLMSFILFFGTYACSMALKQFKTSRFFPTTVSGDPLGGVGWRLHAVLLLGHLHSQVEINLDGKKMG